MSPLLPTSLRLRRHAEQLRATAGRLLQALGLHRSLEPGPRCGMLPGDQAMDHSATSAQVLEQLAALEDPAVADANRKRGNDFGHRLGDLRKLAKTLRTQHSLAEELWATGNTSARLVATLVSRPKQWTAQQLDRMACEANSNQLMDWLVVHVVAKSPHAETMRLQWKDQGHWVGRAGWSLTTTRVVRGTHDLDVVDLLDTIERDMGTAHEPKQWAMNHCLAEIGIRFPEHRARAIQIGKSLGVFADYPTSPGCTPPYAPTWIREIVSRNEEGPRQPSTSAKPRSGRAIGSSPAPNAQPKLLSGGNPQIPKGDGDEPVRQYIAAMPGWKHEAGQRLDALIESVVPNVRRAVRWNSPFYGMPGKGWFLSFHCYTHYLKISFLRGAQLQPPPPIASKHESTRYVHLTADNLDSLVSDQKEFEGDRQMSRFVI